MSSTTRDDWILAEVEYLLRLANQRLIIQKNFAGAEELMLEADALIMRMDDPSLYYIRQSIADDVAKIRLAKKVDVEGIYAELSALSKSVDAISSQPKIEEAAKELVENIEQFDQQINIEEKTSVWENVKQSFSGFVGNFQKYFKVTNHEQKQIKILTPEILAYSKQNLKLMIARAQLGLLREKQNVFSDSLTEAAAWAQQQFAYSEKANTIAQQLELVSQQTVTIRVPDISDSLALIRVYLENLHDVKNRADKKQSGTQQEAP